MIVIDTPAKAAGLPDWKIYYGVDWGFEKLQKKIIINGVRIIEDWKVPASEWGVILEREHW